MTLVEKLKRSGWDPFDLSEECRAATELPWMPSRLSDKDRLGLYHNYLFLLLFSRFGEGASYKKKKQAGELVDLATRFTLRRTHLGGSTTPEVTREWSQRIMGWQQGVLGPALKRMAAADPAVVLENPSAFEPAYSLIALNFEMKLVDPEHDLQLMGLGRAMHDENRKHPKEPVPTSEAECEAIHEWLTSEGEAIVRRNASGMIEIDPGQVKTQMDSKIGKVLRSRATGSTRCEFDEPEPAEILEALAAIEQVERVREVRDDRLEDAEEGSPPWHVLQNFFELATGELSFRDLSERSGIPRTTLQDAFAVERKAIVQALRAA